MNDIFTNLYNKVLGFFKKTEANEEVSAKDVACNRLRVVLMQDRTNLTPELMERMRKELVELLSRYVEMDKEALELNLEHDGDQVALMLSIPVIRAKDEEEIIEALEEAEKQNDEETSEEETETCEDDEEIEIDEAEVNDANEDLALEIETTKETKKN
ncbi:MAG: cell division topological specificity factor MinE [Candidatus Gastranaerophilales bacterium]